MATTYKILGQIAPASTAVTDLYTVPTGTQVVVSTITVCNLSTAAQSFRLATTTGGAPASADWVYYNLSVPTADTFAASLAVTLDAADKIKVQSGSTGTVFAYQVYGAEIT